MRKLIFLLLLPSALMAQREPVLKQIDLPHPYYYREMYLPQLTSGPSWVTWSPDSKEVIYSMAGSLWRQKIDSNEAVQLTDGPGYDYQPDWSHDAKFDHEISPAWSPDGKDIIFVSNQGHIHGTGGIWRATVPDSGMIDTNSNAKEIHYEETNWKARPEFSPDGKKIVYASYLGRQWHQLW